MGKASTSALQFGAFVLLAGLALAVWGNRAPPTPEFHGSVKSLLSEPAEMAGWAVDFQPIANTPEAKAKVQELLNYDDAIFAVYTRGAQRVSVYIAYWLPGKMSHRLVAGHTPDVCWVNAGWRKIDGRKLHGVSVDGRQLQPVEERTMSLNGHVESVAFWHLVSGKAVSYDTGWRPPWYAMWDDILTMGLNQRQEQFFLRISGNGSSSEIWNADPVRRLLAQFPMEAPNPE